MNYYERHIGDYIRDTAHLSLLEHGVYARLLDVYYLREEPIPQDKAQRLIGARSAEERAAVDSVLAEFFVLCEDGWHQKRCDQQIDEFRAFQRSQTEKAKAGAAARWKHKASPEDARGHAPGMPQASPKDARGINQAMPNDALPLPTSHFPLPTSPEEEGRDLTLLPVPTVVERERSTGDVERVFAHWQREHEHPHSKLDAKRRSVIARALKSYPADVLCRSISGYRNSPHHMGQNDRGTRYDSIELFLRDAAHVDAGLKFADTEVTHAPATRFSRTVAHLDRLIAEAEREEFAALESPDVDLRPALGG